MRMLIVLMLTVVLVFGLRVYTSQAAEFNEAWHVNKWCTEQNGQQEYVLPDKARVDCLTETHAIEFDWGKKWAELIGQALYYSYITNKKAGVVLIVEPGEEDRYIQRLQTVANHLCIDFWLMENENTK